MNISIYYAIKNYKNYVELTPKGPNVRTADKPLLVSVTWAHTIFWFFETFVKMRLAISFTGKKILFFRPVDQKLWMFEVLRRSMGRAGMYWSQPARVDYISPKRWAVGIRNLEKSPLRVSSPIFWTLPLHLGGWNLPSPMEHGDFNFFQILFLLNLEYTWTFIKK
jgi:hypothetical protein